MIRRVLAVALFALVALGCQGQPSLPSSFHAKAIHSPAGADIFVRWGGTGPVVLLLHGYAENSDSWAPLAEDLMKDHTVVVPDLRGIGRSSKPVSGYDKKTQAQDMRAVVTDLGYDRTFVVAHDIGNMVAYAYAALYPDKVDGLVVMDAPIPGIDPWSEILQNPACVEQIAGFKWLVGNPSVGDFPLARDPGVSGIDSHKPASVLILSSMPSPTLVRDDG
jgi:pimeloyl-ACP methyl ester carboxylesterase